MILVRAGRFWMGDMFNDTFNKFHHRDRQRTGWWEPEVEMEKHCVSIADFFIAETAVTFDEYDEYCIDMKLPKPFDEGWGRGRRPVININWFDAIGYCAWKSVVDGLAPCYKFSDALGHNYNTIGYNHCANGYRLPSEFEWEFAAREGGETARFGNGKKIADPNEINFDSLQDINYWYDGNYFIRGISRKQTIEVKSTSQNALGLYEMSGNVWELCKDWYSVTVEMTSMIPDYAMKPWSHVSTIRVKAKGGSWEDAADDVLNCNYWLTQPVTKCNTLGFRIAKNVE